MGLPGDVVVDSIVGLSTYRNNMNAYSAVICNIRMPGKSGFEVAKELNKENQLIQIILMSDNEKDCYDDKENNESCKNFSDKFAAKPKSVEEVVDLISDIWILVDIQSKFILTGRVY